MKTNLNATQCISTGKLWINYLTFKDVNSYWVYWEYIRVFTGTVGKGLYKSSNPLFAYCLCVPNGLYKSPPRPRPWFGSRGGGMPNLGEWEVGGKGAPLGHLLANVRPNNTLGGQYLPPAGIWGLFQPNLASGGQAPKCLNFCITIWGRQETVA